MWTSVGSEPQFPGGSKEDDHPACRTIVGIAGPEGPTDDLIARPMGMDETTKNKNRTDPIMGFSAETEMDVQM